MITLFGKLLPILAASLLAAFPAAQGAVEFEYGQRPATPVFDPSGLLNPDAMKEISEPLAALLESGDIDIIVVVLPDLGQSPPELVAGRFAQAWCKSPLHCVVLHVPGQPDSPWLVPGGKLIAYLNPEQIREAVTAARRRAASEAKDADKLKAAAHEAADLLQFWMATAKNYRAMIQAESAKMRQELNGKSAKWKLGLMISAALLVTLVIGITVLAQLTGKREPRTFPFPNWQPRLCAPHAGGNHAVADLGPPLP